MAGGIGTGQPVCRSIPYLEVEGASALDEFYWLNKDDPNRSRNRATLHQGESAHTENRFDLSDEAALEMKLYLQHFLHHIGGLPDMSALKFTKYNPSGKHRKH